MEIPLGCEEGKSFRSELVRGFVPGLCEIVRASTVLIALQFSVSLQTEESIQEEFQRRRGQPISFSTHARHQEACLHTAQSSFSLPIPLSSTPGFTTNIG